MSIQRIEYTTAISNIVIIMERYLPYIIKSEEHEATDMEWSIFKNEIIWKNISKKYSETIGEFYFHFGVSVFYNICTIISHPYSKIKY